MKYPLRGPRILDGGSPLTPFRYPFDQDTSGIVPGPLAIAGRGTGATKALTTAQTIAAVSAAANGNLIVGVCYNQGLGNIDTIDWGGQLLTKLRSQAVGLNSIAEIWAIYNVLANSLTLTANISAGTLAIAMLVSEITNLALVPNDQQTGASGSGTAPSSGATAATTLAKELWWGAIGSEGPQGDTRGTWQNGFTAAQRVGTTGGVAATNVTIDEGYLIVAATGAATAAKTGATSRSWGAQIQTLKGN